MNSDVDSKAADLPIDDPFAAAFVEEDVQGRSLWVDAWHRLLKNRAAVVSSFIMIIMVLAVLFGPMLLPWEGDFTDWDNTSSPPSMETGHWFGTDAVGRDLLGGEVAGAEQQSGRERQPDAPAGGQQRHASPVHDEVPDDLGAHHTGVTHEGILTVVGG